MGEQLKSTTLHRSFFDRPVLEVAPDLLGVVLSHDGVAVRLTEVEAYDGPNDPGSHAYRGRTPRNVTMFGPPGHLYVYFSYGIHWCANVVCGPEGTASAVLLRAGEVVQGAEVAQRRRGERVAARDLARGPARLTQALGITLRDNGQDLRRRPLRIHAPARAMRLTVVISRRIGITRSPELPLRFSLRGSPFVSKPAPRASAPRKGVRSAPLRRPGQRPILPPSERSMGRAGRD